MALYSPCRSITLNRAYLRPDNHHLVSAACPRVWETRNHGTESSALQTPSKWEGRNHSRLNLTGGCSGVAAYKAFMWIKL